MRLIADLRHSNFYLDPPKFKMDDLRAALPSIEEANYTFSFDVARGYYHIDLAPEVQELFGFAFKVGREQYYDYYTVVPFGIGMAPNLFCKLLKSRVSKWRGLGLHIYVFIDNGLGLCKTKQEGDQFSQLVRKDLADTGLTEQTKKCIWDVTKVLVWLGVLINLATRKLIAPEQKRQTAIQALQECLQNRRVSPRQLARVSGLITSLQPVIGNKALIHTKQFCKETIMYARSRSLGDKQIQISGKTRKCAEFWIQELSKEVLERDFSIPGHSIVIYSDASGTGRASYIQADDYKQMLQNDAASVSSTNMTLVQRTADEAKESSTWREVRTIELGLRAFRRRLRNRSVLWRTDSLPGLSTIYKGSMKEKLNPLAVRIRRICEENSIQLQVKWVRRDLNKVADKLSRFVDLDDWGINRSFFLQIQTEWNCWCTVDRFASAENKKLPRYNSKFADINSEGIDMFTQSGKKETNWTVPPPHLIPQ